MMCHVWGSISRYRIDENGMRISSVQPCGVIRVAESQKKSGDASSFEASSRMEYSRYQGDADTDEVKTSRCDGTLTLLELET